MEEDLKHLLAPLVHVPYLLHHHRRAPVPTRVDIKEFACYVLRFVQLLASDLGNSGEGGRGGGEEGGGGGREGEGGRREGEEGGGRGRREEERGEGWGKQGDML